MIGARRKRPEPSARGAGVLDWARRAAGKDAPGGGREDVDREAGENVAATAVTAEVVAEPVSTLLADSASVRRQNPPEPRAHADAALLDAKRARVDEPHVRPLNDVVRQLRAQRDPRVPWVDPDGAGVAARVLFLFESPGAAALEPAGSGILSADNDDPASATFFTLRQEAGLPRDRLLAWSVVPWPLESAGGKPRAAVAADLSDAEAWLHRVVGLLPELALVVTVGTPARDAWLRLLTARDDAPLVPTLAVSQTTPNAVRVGDSRARILLAMRRAAEVCG